MIIGGRQIWVGTSNFGERLAFLLVGAFPSGRLGFFLVGALVLGGRLHSGRFFAS